MDDRKRTFEPNEHGAVQPKRLRPEDVLGMQKDDPTKVVTRIFLSKSQYSKVIGKGGQMILQIRTLTGAALRGVELDEDNRIMLIVGSLVQVLNAFDVVAQVITPAPMHANSAGQRPISLSHPSSASNFNPEAFAVCLMMENSKTGRVVGAKGSTLLSLKRRSGAVVQVEKEPIEYGGISVRKVFLDGTTQSVRMVHYLLHELFVDPHTASTAIAAIPHLRALLSGGVVDDAAVAQQQQQLQLQQQQQQQQPHYGGGYPTNKPATALLGDAEGPHQLTAPSLLKPTGYTREAVSLPSLVSFGVPPETVKQLIEMQSYLVQQFGLELGMTKLTPVSEAARPGRESFDAHAPQQQQQMQMPSAALLATDSGNRTVESVIALRRENSPQDIFFAIPRSCVGGIIGRGGMFLKNLQAEFGVRVYIEKDEYFGQRIVALIYQGNGQEVSSARKGGDDSSSTVLKQIAAVTGEIRKTRFGNNNEKHDLTAEGEEGHPKKTVKRAAAGSDDEEAHRGDREGDTAGDAHEHQQERSAAAHKRNRRDDSGRGELEEGDAADGELRDLSTSPAPKRKSGADFHSGDTRDGSDASEGEEGGEEGRFKRKRGINGSRSPHREEQQSPSSAGAAVSVAELRERSLKLCKERIEAMVEDLLQRQISDVNSI